jgi:chromosomal replication initiator protein
VSGPPGSGKTHLVQAIAHQLLERDPSARVLYVKAAKLGALLAEAAGSPLSARLRRRLLDLDLLIVDDLHELSGSAAVQEELSAAWTELQENGRQVVLASERSIEELGTFSGAMKTFLEGSLPVSLKELGRGTTLAVLKKRSESMDLNLGDDEIAFLAESAGFSIKDTIIVLKTTGGIEDPEAPDFNIDEEAAEEAFVRYFRGE